MFLASCINHEKNEVATKSVSKKSDEKFISINDSTWGYEEFRNDTLRMAIINHALKNFVIEIKLNKQTVKYDLNKLQIPFKTPSLAWVNKDFACFDTWWSGPFSKCFFVPLKDLNNLIYIDKDIQATDKVNNNFVYVDSVIENNEIRFVAQNLKTERIKHFKFQISQNNLYPYFDSLKMTKKWVTFWKGNKQMKFDIASVN